MRLDDLNHAIGMAGSEHRAPVLLDALKQVTPEVGNKLLQEWFPICEAIGPLRHDLREQFVRCGFVTDTEEALTLPVTIYRAAWEDDEPETGLSWTTDLDFAKKFCKGLTSIRAQFLGYYRTDVDAYIWQAECDEALAYFQAREEGEVIPAHVYDVEPIAKLVTLPAKSGE